MQARLAASLWRSSRLASGERGVIAEANLRLIRVLDFDAFEATALRQALALPCSKASLALASPRPRFRPSAAPCRCRARIDRAAGLGGVVDHLVQCLRLGMPPAPRRDDRAHLGRARSSSADARYGAAHRAPPGRGGGAPSTPHRRRGEERVVTLLAISPALRTRNRARSPSPGCGTSPTKSAPPYHRSHARHPRERGDRRASDRFRAPGRSRPSG